MLPGVNPRLSLNGPLERPVPSQYLVLPGVNPRLSLNELAAASTRPQPQPVLPGVNPRLSLNVELKVIHWDLYVVLPGVNPRLSLNDPDHAFSVRPSRPPSGQF